MKITVKTVMADPFITVTTVSDGKNSIEITEEEDIDTSTTTIQSNSDSIYPIMDFLKILEAVG